MSNPVIVLTERIGDALSYQVSQAKHRLTVAAPFIKRKTLERLLGGLEAAVELTVITRWTTGEIIAGVSDLSVFDFIRDRGHARLLLHPSIHAKVFLVDDVAGVGSANVTDAAMGFTDSPNAEALSVIRPAPNNVFLFLSKLEKESIVATEELRLRFEEATKLKPPTWEAPAVEVKGPPARPPLLPFPRFRSPERLYSAYVSVVEFGNPDIRDSLLDDLADLNLPDGLDEPDFLKRVGAALLAVTLIAEIDAFVIQPQYFGALADWLRGKGVLPDRGQEERKRYLQTLVRWLLHFLPGRYRLEEPNYSELFGRVEGWARRNRGT